MARDAEGFVKSPVETHQLFANQLRPIGHGVSQTLRRARIAPDQLDRGLDQGQMIVDAVPGIGKMPFQLDDLVGVERYRLGWEAHAPHCDPVTCLKRDTSEAGICRLTLFAPAITLAPCFIVRGGLVRAEY